jgi:hypothetical protein
VNVHKLCPARADTEDVSIPPETLDATATAAQTLELRPTSVRVLVVDGHAEILGSGE